jgi:putative transposase
MPRTARIVIPDVPHHITHRANGSLVLFPTDQDSQFYLTNIRSQCLKFKVNVYAYCLMTNHVHFILVPPNLDSLSQVMRNTQGSYSQYYNFQNDNRGHVWEERYYSCSLDDAHFVHAMRYVDRNPVRAGLVTDPVNYPWSSARAHSGMSDPAGLIDMDLIATATGIHEWRLLLSEQEDDQALDRIREHTRQGRPMRKIEKE